VLSDHDLQSVTSTSRCRKGKLLLVNITCDLRLAKTRAGAKDTMTRASGLGLSAVVIVDEFHEHTKHL
jgi:hypothetical protein